MARRMFRMNARPKKRKNPSRKRRNPRHARRHNDETKKAKKKTKAISKAEQRALMRAEGIPDATINRVLGAERAPPKAKADPFAGLSDRDRNIAEKVLAASAAGEAIAADPRAVEFMLSRGFVKAKPGKGLKKSAFKKKPKPRAKKEKVKVPSASQRAKAEADQIILGTLVEGDFYEGVPARVERRTPTRGKNKGIEREIKRRAVKSSRALAASMLDKKGQSEASRAIAKAWKAAKKAQRLGVSAKDQAHLRAFGLAGVPNPSASSLMSDLGTLMPQIGVSAVSLAGAAWLGQMVADKLPAEQKTGTVGKIAPSAVSAIVGIGGYMLARKSPAMAKFAPAILFGGVAAAVVHAIARITVKGKKADGTEGDVSLGQKLGLPIGEYASMAGYGEYASMAGFGEYASMAGGTAYSGERGIFAGLDDTDPVLSGTDDEDEVDMVETLSDEGVNADEGSLNGSIFD